jgi:hypothetical protein
MKSLIINIIIEGLVGAGIIIAFFGSLYILFLNLFGFVIFLVHGRK